MKQTIFFDLDDTLVYCNKYFNDVLDRFADEMYAWYAKSGVTREAIAAKQAEIDIAGVQVVGFQPDHFPQSFVETYRFFRDATGRASSVLEEEKLWKLGNSVYGIEVEPYPMMEETLYSLANKGNELHLYTGGDTLIQYRKIESLRLDRFFEERIYVRQHKNTDALEEILASGRFDRSNTWMIGNSVRTDVVPALLCGLNAVYLKQDEEWKYNIIPIETPPTGALLTLTALPQVPPAISDYLSGLTMKESG
ncbi:HAD family hydrolase [Cohnella suwonensis]|uniref:HAD family hydrolase n=1 Tax=Cohnella suwonensis TaxID=696072 RepID=A0ABW0LP70_9BACL